MQKFETRAIRLQMERTHQKEHSTPIFPTSSFVFADAEEMRMAFTEEIDANIYSRYSNPSVEEFESKMASLENAEMAIATASGMSAVFACFACHLKQGDHVLLSQAVFGSTIKLFENFFGKWGITYDLVNSTRVEDWQKFVKRETKMLYLETPSNPALDIFDLSAFASFAKANTILLVVDNCFATPYLQNPIDHGCDLVIHSATKYIDGQGRVLGGVVAGRSDLVSAIVPFMRNAGPTLSPFNAWILSKSLETLSVRMDRHCENAMGLALYLENRPEVLYVKYPFLTSHPGNQVANKQMRAGGGIVAFELKGGVAAGRQFIDRVKMLSISPNLGDTRSIITHPASSTHSKLTQEQREQVGITDGLIRVSVGLEHLDDIIADIDQAFGQ
ncbi:MAG TPA: O-succinylhomoserine sulfhydrylase [Saprospiraceae bacterium]|nr:O-succinylhomoserine sulfhydrylase [Saprospiraceae bacterium]